MDAKERKYDLEDRLIDFSGVVIDVVESLPEKRTGAHIGNQVLRSGTSAAPNYGEAQSAESRRDFIHKMKVCLKELRETMIWLKLTAKKNLVRDTDLLRTAMSECEELIRIFVKSLSTAESKLDRRV